MKYHSQSIFATQKKIEFSESIKKMVNKHQLWKEYAQCIYVSWIFEKLSSKCSRWFHQYTTRDSSLFSPGISSFSSFSSIPSTFCRATSLFSVDDDCLSSFPILFFCTERVHAIISTWLLAQFRVDFLVLFLPILFFCLVFFFFIFLPVINTRPLFEKIGPVARHSPSSLFFFLL